MIIHHTYSNLLTMSSSLNSAKSACGERKQPRRHHVRKESQDKEADSLYAIAQDLEVIDKGLRKVAATQPDNKDLHRLCKQVETMRHNLGMHPHLAYDACLSS